MANTTIYLYEGPEGLLYSTDETNLDVVPGIEAGPYRGGLVGDTEAFRDAVLSDAHDAIVRIEGLWDDDVVIDDRRWDPGAVATDEYDSGAIEVHCAEERVAEVVAAIEAYPIDA